MGNKYDYRQLRELINANHDRFSELNFDSSLSMQQKMNSLVEWFKVMLKEYNDWVEYLDDFKENFDEKLYDTLDDILNVWLNDGKLAEIVRQAINDEVVEARTTPNPNGKTYGSLSDRLNQQFGLNTDFREFEIDLSFMKRIKNEFNERGINAMWFGLKDDGVTDNSDILNAMFDNSLVKSIGKVIIPPNKKIYCSKKVSIKSKMDIDFQGSEMIFKKEINTNAFEISAQSNVTVRNLNVTLQNNDYIAYGLAGICVTSTIGVDIENVKLINCIATGFKDSIRIAPVDGSLARNIYLENCKGTRGQLSGIGLENIANIRLINCSAISNGQDGLKVYDNVRELVVDGGSYSNNVTASGGYADGIDCYAGARQTIITNVIAESNSGTGIHIMTGEVNDPNYIDYWGQKVDRLIISKNIIKNNGATGIDIVVKKTVSPTAPYVTQAIVTENIVYGNDLGIDLTSRNVIVSNNIISLNQRFGIQLQLCVNISLLNNQVIRNSMREASIYSGINILGSKNISVIGGLINGSDTELLQNDDGSSITPQHLSNIVIDNLDNTDNILIDVPTMINYSDYRPVRITNFDTSKFNDKNIIIKYYNPKTIDIRHCYGGVGSKIIIDSRIYEKVTKLNSTSWQPLYVMNASKYSILSDGSLTTVVFPHGLTTTPLSVSITPRKRVSPFTVNVDETNITLTFQTPLTQETHAFDFQVWL